MELPEIADPERRIAIAYARPEVRDALTILFAIDERLAGIVARTSEPAIGLIRLVWWRDALAALDDRAPPAEPLLIAAASLAKHDVVGAELGAMTAGWEALLDDPALDDETVRRHAEDRGSRLFELGARIMGSVDVDRPRAAGEGWARAELARHVVDEARAGAILASARSPLDEACHGGWPRVIRPLGQLAVLALDDVRRGVRGRRAPASPARLFRILRLHIIRR